MHVFSTIVHALTSVLEGMNRVTKNLLANVGCIGWKKFDSPAGKPGPTLDFHPCCVCARVRLSPATKLLIYTLSD
jgi:hypothetical protein